jgi:hypothetical protein
MAGLVPAIHVFGRLRRKGVDTRHKAGHDESKAEPIFWKATASRTK